ncbi:spore gernimation protein KB [Domibacillus antri]|uniref:Spore gernimation protein KB n=1 Tax=Domibacillus antri TaxID=1714264 RepID=A0A1Q8Q291_9BACI|nr:GerAB/ArcD/ProY family transporter [Domibacillus antri]OLN21437.1 spore gernimation protein KB [Domibacillus antri]
MEKAKISAYQLFVLIVLFELGSALLLPLAIEAKQDAWLAILIGMAGGCCLFFIYYGLYHYYPDILPTEYTQKIIGKFLGRILSFLYILYFMYLAARVLRDFGEMLLIFAYSETPLFVTNSLLIIVIIYTVRKGIEVLARTGELLFVFIGLLAVSGFLLITLSGVIQVTNLQPVLENGMLPVVKTAITQTLYIPFGEIIVFAMIIPYLNRPEKLKRTGLYALGVSGFSLALVMAMNISVLGVSLTARSQFPLLSTIQTIQVEQFLERLDVYFMLTLVIGGFFKIAVFSYAAVTGAANLFNVKEPSRLVYPIGVVILLISMIIASSFSEHIEEGVKVIPLYVHLPFQIIIPTLLLFAAYLKNRNKNLN